MCSRGRARQDENLTAVSLDPADASSLVIEMHIKCGLGNTNSSADWAITELRGLTGAVCERRENLTETISVDWVGLTVVYAKYRGYR
jgi:hypothetical protein